jgi:hypothetical protein
MIRKYKLVQTYPNSPNIGTIVGIDEVNSPYWYDATSGEFPQLWKLIDIDYEIISIKRTTPSYGKTNEWTPNGGYSNTLESMLKIGSSVSNGDYYINAIRRTSDNMIFVKGDTIQTSVTDSYCSIYNFNINEDRTLEIDCTHSYLAGVEGIDLLKDMEHSRDYEIQSFRLHQHCTAKLEDDGLYHTVSNDAIGKRLDEMMDSDYYIHSVKRLSDGEVFTVGDKIQHNTGIVDTITSIQINGNFISSIKTPSKVAMVLSLITHIQNPLFTTEDDVDIFEGDSYWCVNTAPHLWSLFEQTAKERTKLNKTVKAWKCKQLAKKYIIEHKPLISVYDIFGDDIAYVGINKETVMDIAKKNLNEKTINKKT